MQPQQPMQAPTENTDALQRVVLAGMKVMYDQKIFQTFQQALAAQGPVPQKLAAQAVGLLKILMDKSGGTIPKNVLVPAATMLMFEMGDFMVKAGLGQPTKQDMADAVKLVIQMVLKLYAGPQQGAPQGQPEQPQPAQPQGMMGAPGA